MNFDVLCDCRRSQKENGIKHLHSYFNSENNDVFDIQQLWVGCYFKKQDEQGDIINDPTCFDSCEGATLIDVETTPVEWIKNIVNCLPKTGAPITVVRDENESVILGFSYEGNDYECINTKLSCTLLDPVDRKRRITYYQVETTTGEALIIHIKNLRDFTEEPESWMLYDIMGSSTVSASLGKKQDNTVFAYRIVFEIENMLRKIVSSKFPDTDTLFKSIDVTFNDKKKSLYETLKKKKDIEAAKLLAEPNTPLIEYMDWSNWIEIFEQQHKILFSNFSNSFEAMKSFKNYLEQIQPVRNKVAHMREVEIEDIKTLRQAGKRIQQLLT